MTNFKSSAVAVALASPKQGYEMTKVQAIEQQAENKHQVEVILYTSNFHVV